MSIILPTESEIRTLLEGPDQKTSQNEEHTRFVIDGHVDLPCFAKKKGFEGRFWDIKEGPFTRQKMDEGGVRLFACVLYCEDRYNGAEAFARLTELLEFTLSGLGEEIALVKTLEGLGRVLEPEAAPGAVLLLENADGLTDHGREIPEFMEKGIRIVGLTHVGSNRLGDGCLAAHSSGLTQEGKETVKALVKHGLLLDVAHLHPRCFKDLLDLCEGPIVSSHTGLRRLCDSPGNLDPDQVREIVSRDGLIGITFNPEMLSEEGTADAEQAFIHIDWIVQKYGPGAAAIGSDFCGFDRPTRGLEDISRIPALEALMNRHGYGTEAMADILGRNWLRLYEQLFQ